MSRVTNLAEEIYREQQRRSMSGSFGYGDFGIRKNEELHLGIANADKIVDEANMSWTDQQLNEAKAKWRELVSNFNAANQSRNEIIAAIKQMQPGADKTIAIGQFNEADGVFMQAYSQAQPLFQKIGDLTGDSFPAASDANFGVIPLAVWALAAASLVVIAALASQMYEAHLKYDAIKTNPAVAQYVESGSSGILSSILGQGATQKLVYGGLAILAVSILWKKIA